MRRAGYSEKRGGLTRIGRFKANVAKSGFGKAIGYNRLQNSYVQSAQKITDLNKEAAASLSSETVAVDIANYLKEHPGASANDYYQEKIDKSGGDIRELDAAILTMQKRGVKNKDIMAMLRKSQNSGKLKFADEQSRSNWMNSMLRNHGDIVSTDYDFQEWARDGGVGELGDYGDYVKANRTASDIDISDLSKVSGNSMAGLIRAGMVSAPVAQQWLAANPNASPDKKVMMGAVASGVVTSTSLAGVTAEQFKKEAEDLANKPDGSTMKTNIIAAGVAASRPGEKLEDLVGSWTTTAQVRTYISQDNSTIAPGQQQKKSNPVFVQGVEAGGSNKEEGQQGSSELSVSHGGNGGGG